MKNINDEKTKKPKTVSMKIKEVDEKIKPGDGVLLMGKVMEIKENLAGKFFTVRIFSSKDVFVDIVVSHNAMEVR